MIDLAATNEGEEQRSAVLQSLLDPTNPSVPPGSWIAVDGSAPQSDKPVAAQSVHFDLRGVYPLVPIEEYHRYGSLGAFSQFIGEEQPFSTVLSRRGCRTRCTFCTVRNFNGPDVRKREVRAVIDELKYLVNERGVIYIDWLDDDLLFDREHVLEMFNAMADELPSLKWTASNGLIGVSIDDEVMDAMARSGLQAYKIGIESGNDRILHNIKKPTTKKKLRERKEIFTKHKHIFFSTNLILGFPEETFSEMMDTFLFAQKLEQDWASFYIMQPLKGTEMYAPFQSLGEERCSEESYDKTINPGSPASARRAPGSTLRSHGLAGQLPPSCPECNFERTGHWPAVQDVGIAIHKEAETMDDEPDYYLYDEDHPMLRRIVLPASEIPNLRLTLRREGITREKLMPTLGNAARAALEAIG